VVEKGKEKWEIAGCLNKVTGTEVGSKVTIEYTMKAVSVEVKDTGKKQNKETNRHRLQPRNNTAFDQIIRSMLFYVRSFYFSRNSKDFVFTLHMSLLFGN
jgi:hypothetical protein